MFSENAQDLILIKVCLSQDNRIIISILVPLNYWYTKNMVTTIQLICLPQWMNKELSTAADIVVRHSYGLDLPTYSLEDIWWMPQEIAARVLFSMEKQNLVIPRLTSPGPEWLTKVPKEYSGRIVNLYTVKEIQADPELITSGWWKSAEAKIESFVSKYRTTEELLEDIIESNLPEDSLLQVSHRKFNIAREFRFYIKDKKVLTGSLYLDKTNPEEELTYYDGATATLGQYEAAADYAALCAENLEAPPAYVLDIVETVEGEFCVLEANMVFASAWYDSNINNVVEALIRSERVTDQEYEKWKWVPDSYHQNKVEKKFILEQSTAS